MTLFFGLLTFFIILAVLILVHEIGHFAFAKLFRVRVEEFGLGFPPRLKSWRRGGTTYSLNAIPIGGFVKMMGENGEAEDPDSFGSKPQWQRLIILGAGPSMNLLLAVAIFFFAFVGGTARAVTVVTKVSPGSPAAAAGLHVGDRIVSFDGRTVRFLDDLRQLEQAQLGHPALLRVRRGSRTFRVSLVPRTNPPRGQGAMGLEMSDVATVHYSPGQSLNMSAGDVWSMIASVPQLLATISQHGGSQVTGPIGIAHITTNVVNNEPHQGPGSLLEFMALLSANLGVLNLLPIPALDGGRIVFVLISWIRRRNLDPQLEGLIHMAGMALLLLLIAVISYQDLIRWVTGASF